MTRDGVAVLDEQAAIGGGGGNYVWENARGTTGVIVTSPDGDGDLDCEALTEPNADTLRHFDSKATIPAATTDPHPRDHPPARATTVRSRGLLHVRDAARGREARIFALS